MKPSLEQLKAGRDNARNGIEHGERIAREYRADLAKLDAQIAAEEEREAKAKEWPQEGDEVWFPGSFANETHAPYYGEHTGSWLHLLVELGIAQKTQDDAAIVHRFLRSRPRGWLLAMAKLGNAFSVWKSPDGIRNSGDAVNLSSTYEIDKWDALTEDERAALLGQG